MFRPVFVVLAATLLCGSFFAASQTHSVAAKSAGNVHAGQEVFTHRCFQCHSTNEGQVKFGPSLYHVMKGPHGKTAPEIRTILENGKGKMPSFKAILSKQDVDNILAYLHAQ